jgi:hypothetical protein
MRRRLPLDYAAYVDRRHRLAQAVRAATTSGDMRDLEILALAFEDIVAQLKRLAERYLPVVLVISLSLLYEQLTTSQASVTSASVDLGKVALWVLLGPTVAFGVLLVMIGYENNLRRYESGLTEFIKRKAHPSNDTQRDELRRARELRESLTWDRAPGSFLFTVVKSATIAIPLLSGVIVYVIDTLSKTHQWLYIFVPEPVLRILSSIYCISECR